MGSLISVMRLLQTGVDPNVSHLVADAWPQPLVRSEVVGVGSLFCWPQSCTQGPKELQPCHLRTFGDYQSFRPQAVTVLVASQYPCRITQISDYILYIYMYNIKPLAYNSVYVYVHTVPIFTHAHIIWHLNTPAHALLANQTH